MKNGAANSLKRCGFLHGSGTLRRNQFTRWLRRSHKNIDHVPGLAVSFKFPWFAFERWAVAQYAGRVRNMYRPSGESHQPCPRAEFLSAAKLFPVLIFQNSKVTHDDSASKFEPRSNHSYC
jgi:hypothetical protein